MGGILNEGLGVAGNEGTYQRSFDIWNEFNLGELLVNPGAGFYTRERFDACPVFASAVSQNGGITYQDSGATVQGIATVLGGAIRFATPATNNNEAHHQVGGNVGAAYKIDSSAFRSLAHEACFRLNTYVETGFYFGLGEAGFAVENALVDDTGALVSKNFIGFHMPAHASAGTLSFVYRKNGQAMQTIKSGALSLSAAMSGFATGGFKFDRYSRKLSGYVNGALVGELSYSDWPAGLFPDAAFLSPCRGIKSGEAVAKTFDLLWADTACLR